MGNIFRVSHFLQLSIAKYEKRGKYFPILHEQRAITTLSLNDLMLYWYK